MKEIEHQTEDILGELQGMVKPYRGKYESFTRLPAEGKPQEDIIAEISKISDGESTRWKDGFVSGAVYHGSQEYIEFLNTVYAVTSQNNPLHSDLFPSASKFESEIVAMTASMLGSQGTADDICGAVSSGGTESILLAMKTYRDWAKETKGITRPEIVIPATAHAAFDKAGEYFHIKVNHIPVDSDFRVDVQQVKKAITNNTIAVVGSAPSFPHGVIDPLEALAQIALDRHIGFHVDACLVGFVLPWAEKLGYSVPPFDFRLAGVTSMSADTHKFGYAAKGTSVVLYRGKDLRQFQYFTASDWPGGLYFSPTFAGSRPGALSAVCWAALLSMGENGYLQAVQCILETADTIKAGIKDIPDIHIQGDPLWVIAFASDTVDIYKVMDYMTKKQWNLNGLYKPPCVHICVTLRHAQPGVAEKFISDLQSAVQYVKEHPEEEGEMAPVYGLAANIPFRGVISDLLKQYMDLYYTP